MGNVEGDGVKERIGDMMRGWNGLFGYKGVKRGVVGYFRGLEMRKNDEENR